MRGTLSQDPSQFIHSSQKTHSIQFSIDMSIDTISDMLFPPAAILLIIPLVQWGGGGAYSNAAHLKA